MVNTNCARFALCVLLSVLTNLAYSAKPTQLIGTWELDVERTAEVQPAQPQESNWFKNQNVQTSVSVAGMPLPKIGRKVPPMSSLPEREPRILRCKELLIEPVKKDLRFTYVDIGTEIRKQGDYRGVTTKWGKKKLTESYKTTSRKVTHKFEIQDKNRLLVTVRVNPDQGATRTYKQIFNRKPK